MARPIVTANAASFIDPFLFDRRRAMPVATVWAYLEKTSSPYGNTKITPDREPPENQNILMAGGLLFALAPGDFFASQRNKG
jgi:hypothetical protein